MLELILEIMEYSQAKFCSSQDREKEEDTHDNGIALLLAELHSKASQNGNQSHNG